MYIYWMVLRLLYFFLLAQGFHNSFGFRSLNMGFSRLIFIENCSHQSSSTTIIYLFYVCSALETGRKASLGRAFLACWQRVQIYFIFNYNVHILCLSCSIKRSKATAKLSENSWNKRRSKRFQRRHSIDWLNFCYIQSLAKISISFCYCYAQWF
jgi:hypothetical protein